MPRTTSQNRHRDDFLRHSAGVLVCPRCGIPLQGGDHELGIAWRCDSCRGQSLNFSQFRRLVPEHGARDIWLEALKNPAAPRQRTHCPECLAAMHAVLVPFRGSNIELDICPPCQRLWLDAREEILITGLPGEPVKSVNPMRISYTQGKSDRVATEAMLAVLENRADRQNKRRDKRRHLMAVSVALIAGVIAWIATSSYPARARSRIALAAGISAYFLTLFLFLR